MDRPSFPRAVGEGSQLEHLVPALGGCAEKRTVIPFHPPGRTHFELACGESRNPSPFDWYFARVIQRFASGRGVDVPSAGERFAPSSGGKTVVRNVVAEVPAAERPLKLPN